MSDTPHSQHEEEKEAIDGIIRLANDKIGQLTHVVAAVETCFKKSYNNGYAVGRQEGRRRVLEEVRGLVSVHFNNGVCPPNGQICINSILKEIDQVSKMKETPE